MRRVILIGGGEIKDGETLPIDQQFLRLSGGRRATIGFFPTAAGDSDGYIETFINYYQSLGCQKILPVKISNSTLVECRKMISQMTGIYLGGGSTKTLIEDFERKHIGELIKRELGDDVVVAGMSAGALAVCDYYIDLDVESKKPKIEKGLGFQHDALCLVHYQEKDRPILSRLKKEFPGYKVFGVREKEAILIEGKKIKWLG